MRSRQEWRSNREGYVQAILNEMIPNLGNTVQAIDVYCDHGAFDLEETRRILQAGMDAGLQGRVHAEQVAFTGAAELAAGMGILSADHLEQMSPAGLRRWEQQAWSRCSCPGAQLYLRDPAPPARALVEAGARLAVATDFNPGSSPFGICSHAPRWRASTWDSLWKKRCWESPRMPHWPWAETGRVGLERGPADAVLFELPPGESEVSSLVQYLGGHRTRAVIRNGLLAWAA